MAANFANVERGHVVALGASLARRLALFMGTTREYLSANFPSRGWSGAPQILHVKS